MQIWPPTREAVLPMAIGFGVLAIVCLLKDWYVLTVLLVLIALLCLLAQKSEKLMLLITTPTWILKDKEKDAALFESNPRYRAMVIKKLRATDDQKYRQKVDTAQKAYDALVLKRNEQLQLLTYGKWEKENLLRINPILGQVMINDSPHYYSSIKGAEVNTVYAQRIEENEHSKTVQTRSPSAGGAVVGGIVGGVVGAAVGAAVFSKKNTTTDRDFDGKIIPTCTHIGVKVNVDGFVYELPILSHTVDQGTKEFSDAMKQAAILVDRLRELSVTPVPERSTIPEQDSTILALDTKIHEAELQVQTAVNDKPAYLLPARYTEPVKSYCTDCGTLVVGRYCPKCGKDTK